MNRFFHTAYIIGSFLAALSALFGILTGSPILYGIVPGIIGGISAAIAAVRFLRDKTDLVGFVATLCGFFFYQEYQANPFTLNNFSTGLMEIPIQDQAIGIFLSNLTTATLLICFRITANSMRRTISRWIPDAARVSRASIDHEIMIGFWIVFVIVALPNVIYGKVVVGAIDNILYQRLTWTDSQSYSGFAVWGGAFGGSIANMTLWATSLFLVWLYMLRSRYRKLMMVLGPLVLLWTASVGLQGSRTYLVTMGVASIVYYLGNPRLGKKVFAYALWGGPALFLLLQISTLFRYSGLQSFDSSELSKHMFDIHGNEGASNQIDGIQYFRTDLMENGRAVNPIIGVFRGVVERPIEGLLMPVPRSVCPWKPYDDSAHEFDLWFQNVRLGVPSSEGFLGASPGLIGRELIKYGIFGPFTLFFWLGLLLALAEGLFSTAPASDFHRIFAALLIAFIVAQARDFIPLWFLPFLPAGILLAVVARKARRTHPARLKMGAESKLNSSNRSPPQVASILPPNESGGF